MSWGEKILGIIPVRKGSKGIPGKNKKLLGGKPLVEHTFNSAIHSNLLFKTILSTDDEDIIKLAESYSQIEVPFVRPEHLASDSATSIDVVRHVLNSISFDVDAICLLQATYPFRPNGFIDACIKKFREKKADALISVLPVPHHLNPHWVFEDDKGYLKISTGDEEMITRRQELPPAYYRDGAVYIATTQNINNRGFYSPNMTYMISDEKNYVNIDTPEDWKKAEALHTSLGENDLI